MAQAYPPPANSTQVIASDFGAWLQSRPLRGASTPILTHDGRVVQHDGRPVDLPMVKGDLQQCADSAIRLRAEWLKEKDEPVVFHATSGDPLTWSRYRAGEKPYESQGRIAWKAGGDKTWDGYLKWVFMWAGTRSLAYDTVAVSAPQPGDLLVNPGSPGHAVVLLDVAKRGDDVFVLVGEGYMPAQDFHVEHGPIGGWWEWDEGVQLDHWHMPATGLRRFPEVD